MAEELFDPHGFERQLKTELAKIKSLPYGNDKLLLDFADNYRYKKKQPANMRKTILLRKLREMSEMLNKPISPFGEDEIKKIVKTLQHKEKERGKSYELSYWREYMKDLKIWVKWTNPKKFYEILLDCRDEIAVADPYCEGKKKIRQQDLMTEDTFFKLINASDPQMKACLALLYGAGIRAGECLALDKDSLDFQEDGTLLVNLPSGKTGTRVIKLRADLAYYVAQWHNIPSNSNALFYNKQSKRLSYPSLNDKLHRSAVNAGLGEWVRRRTEKGQKFSVYKGQKVSSLITRRSHATWCLLHMKPAQAKKRLWGNSSTNMDRVYSRITDKDALEDYDRATGNKPEDQKKDLLKGNTCFKCGKTYGKTVKICPNCQVPIDLEDLVNKQDILERKQLEQVNALAEQMEQKFLKLIDEKLSGKKP